MRLSAVHPDPHGSMPPPALPNLKMNPDPRIHTDVLLNRKLLYTAATRARQLLIVVSSCAAIRKCLSLSDREHASCLTERLEDALGAVGLLPPQHRAAASHQLT